MTGEALARLLPATVAFRAVTYDDARAEDWRAWLSGAEAECLASFGARSRRCEFLAGRAAARELLGTCLGVAPAAVPLRRAPDDAVDVPGHDWRVSIAHSGGHAVAAAARHAVGVDLEHIEPRDSAIVDFLFAPEDRGLVDTLPYGPDAALVLCWALKEAVLKARRSGFRTTPKALRLRVDPARGTAAVQVEGGQAWTVFYARLGDYWGTVAVPDDVH